MTTIDPVTNTAVGADATSTTTNTSISSDYDMFLNMLTTQLENQDPTDPMDTDELSVQLATFSLVEQAALTNELLEKLLGEATGSGITKNANLFGKSVLSEAPVMFDGQTIELYPTYSESAETAELVVRDETGTEVDRQSVDWGETTVSWNGVTFDGQRLPDGAYSFEMENFEEDVRVATTPVSAFDTVVELRDSSEGTVIILRSGETVFADQITGVRDV